MKVWIKQPDAGNFVLNDGNGKVALSYQPNDWARGHVPFSLSQLDSANPETAIILFGDKERNGVKVPRYLIFRGDRRAELEALYPDIEKLKEYWRKEGGHSWSDSLDE